MEAVAADRRALRVLVRNAMFRRVQLMALEDSQALGEMDGSYGYGVHEWDAVLDGFFDAHDDILTDTDARSAEFFILDDSQEAASHTWHVRQVVCDSDGDNDWAIDGIVDIVKTQDEGDAVFRQYRVGSAEQLRDVEP